jgi:hypothetical protein
MANLLLSAGLIEGDGLLVAAGHAATLGVGVGLYLASDAVWTGVRHVASGLVF